MNIGILASGGDGAGMNYCLYTLYKRLCKHNKITLFSRGFLGLIQDITLNYDLKFLRKMRNVGGICIKTSRCQEMQTREGVDSAIQTLKNHNIDCLVVMGGNGSLNALKEIRDRGMDVMFIPCSIDNDIVGSDYTIGFDTACHNCTQFIMQVNDTMKSFNRVCIYQAMGRKCPQIAITVGKNINADYVYTDEFCSKEDCKTAIQNSTKDAPIVILRENLTDINELRKYLEQSLKVDVKTCIVGYIQRGGKPTQLEKRYAKKFAKLCAVSICQNKLNSVLISKNKSFYAIDINKI